MSGTKNPPSVLGFASVAFAAAAVGYGLWTAWRSFSGTGGSEELFPSKSVENEYSHIDPDTLDPKEYQELVEQFTLACDYMNGKAGKSLKLGNADKLRFYAYYKTATIGPNTTPKPSLIDFERSAMWNAWSELNGTAKIEAMISYVEQLHRLDGEWRSKVTSKALQMVLGENSTMVCDANQAESEDEDDKLFVEAHAKSREERDDERRKLTENRMLREKEEQQRLLKLKFAHLTGNTTGSTDNATVAANAPTEAANQDTMGPVFSSSAKNVPDGPQLEAATIKISDDMNSTLSTNDDTNDSIVIVEHELEDDLEDDGLTVKNTQNTMAQNDGRSKAINSGTILRVFAGKFYELTELEDISLFQEVIEQENVKAIASQDSAINPEELKNDQELLFSYRVVLVDLYRVTLLHQVAESGTVPQCGILLHTFKYPIDLPDANGNTPLMLAIGNENVEVVKYLISQGANLLAKSSPDGESIEDLISLCDNKVLKELLKKAIDDFKAKQ